MKEEDKFLVGLSEGIERENVLKEPTARAVSYRKTYFEIGIINCPKKHDKDFMWKHCYLPMGHRWPGADCLECPQAQYERQLNQKHRNKCLHSRQEGSQESHHPCMQEKDCPHSEGCSHKNGEEKAGRKRRRGSSLPYRQIDLSCGDNLSEVLSLWSAAEGQRWRGNPCRFPLWRRLCLRAAVLFLRHSARIVVRCPVGYQS